MCSNKGVRGSSCGSGALPGASSSGKWPLSKLHSLRLNLLTHCRLFPTLALLLLLVPRLPGSGVWPFCRAHWAAEETALVKAAFHLCEGWDRAAAGHREKEKKELKIIHSLFSPLPPMCHSLGNGSCTHMTSFQINC